MDLLTSNEIIGHSYTDRGSHDDFDDNEDEENET